MGQLLEGDDDPDINEKELKEIARLLLRHALATHQLSLTAEIISRFPDILDEPSPNFPNRESLLLLIYSGMVLSPQGRPLPDVLNHSFLYVLHDGVKAFLVSHPAAIEKMTREDLVKMIAGLRTLILKAALLSPQFTSRDVQSLMTAFLPTLPISPLNTSQWLDWTNPLHIDLNHQDQHQAVLANISKSNEAMKKYFTAQLKMLAKNRADAGINDKNTDWVMSMWRTIEPRLKSLMRVVVFLLEPTQPYPIMAACKSKRVQVLASRIKGKGSDEQVLSDFWDYTCDLVVKTAFWKSSIVQQLTQQDQGPDMRSKESEALRL